MDLLPIENLSPLPLVNLSSITKPFDGGILPLSNYCVKKFGSDTKCREHYQSLVSKPDGCYQCPYGLASHKFALLGRPFAITGFISFPRLGGEHEAARAKEMPAYKTSLQIVKETVTFFEKTHQIARTAFEEQLKKYPLAFHELRKLNGAIKQRAEKLLVDFGENEEARTIHSSAELMSNNLDLLEIMAAREDLIDLPLNSTINLLDLAYKCKKVYQQRAEERNLLLWVDGNEKRPIIQGNRKTFPALLTVLVENAIKYSREKTRISITAVMSAKTVRLSVHNISDIGIDTQKCFEKGFRSSSNIEGSGLGLFIAQLVAAQHKSKIVCEQRGEAKTFYMDFAIIDFA